MARHCPENYSAIDYVLLPNILLLKEKKKGSNRSPSSLERLWFLVAFRVCRSLVQKPTRLYQWYYRSLTPSTLIIKRKNPPRGKQIFSAFVCGRTSIQACRYSCVFSFYSCFLPATIVFVQTLLICAIPTHSSHT